jgi:hypothetical protein
LNRIAKKISTSKPAKSCVYVRLRSIARSCATCCDQHKNSPYSHERHLLSSPRLGDLRKKLGSRGSSRTITITPDSDRGLRNLIIQVVHNNASQMKDNVKIKKLIVIHNDLAYGLWEVTSTLPSGPKCPVCHVAFVRECESSGKGFVSYDCDGRNTMKKTCSKCRDESLALLSIWDSWNS